MNTPKIIFNAQKTDGGDAFTGQIIFNEVTLNVGNGMNNDGFVAPIAGFYQFSFSAMGGLDKFGINTSASVDKNGRYQFDIADSNNDESSDGNNISYNWIWKLNKGDKVSFRASYQASYLRAVTHSPVNFNGQLVFVET